MNFQYNYSNYTRDGFHQDQGVQHILTTQAGGTYFHGVAPTTGSVFINQPVIWPEYHGYRPQQNHGLLGNSTALPQFLPVTEIPVFHPIPLQGYQGTTLQDGAVAFNPQLQGPVMFVDAMGQQHVTSVTFHPQLQVPLVAMGGAGPQYGVPVPYAPHVQAPVMYVDANGQQHGTTVPINPQLQAPIMYVDANGQQHGTTVPINPQLQAPIMYVDANGQQHGTTVPINPQLQAPIMYVDANRQQHGTAVPFDPQLQAPFTLVDGRGLPHGTFMPSDPHTQAPLLVLDANGQQHGTAVPFDPQLQAPFVLVDSGGLPHGTSLQAPLMLMDATGLQHGTAVPLNPVPTPSEPVQLFDNPQLPSIEQLAAGPSSTGLMRPAPVVQLPVQQGQQTKAPVEVAVCGPRVVTSDLLKPLATTSRAVEEVKTAQAGQPKAKIEPQQPGTSGSKESLVVKPKSQDDTKKEQPHGVMEAAEAKPADKNTSTKQALTTAPVEAGKADANLPKKPKSSLHENADRPKEKKRKHKHDKGEKERKEKRRKKETSSTEKTTKSGEKEGSETDKKAGGLKAPKDESKAKHKDSSNKSKSKKAKEMQPAIILQPRSKLGERIMHSVQVFHKLGDKIEKVRPPKPTPEEAAKTSQSERPSSSGGQRGQPKIPYPVQPYRIPKRPSNMPERPGPSNVPDRPGPSNVSDCAPVRSDADQPRHPEHSQSRPPAPAPEIRAQRPTAPAHPRHPYVVPHFFKNHAHGSVGDYGDGERIMYLKPEHPGMFPLPLVNLVPLPPGAPRCFHCREYSATITAARRAEREAMKRDAKRQRDEAAKITRNGMDCSVLADQMHLPREPWPRKDNWLETELDEVWNLDECMLGPRDDLMLD
ncbi:proteoglycan 4-like [Alosa alosa]|uniref:proteoglycan 4-like n=1 Tax=Alosa alosa TaxID=278164 RepID=UPI002015103A|nr:proteoglycan 4-like [Alosa alosa]